MAQCLRFKTIKPVSGLRHYNWLQYFLYNQYCTSGSMMSFPLTLRSPTCVVLNSDTINRFTIIGQVALCQGQYTQWLLLGNIPFSNLFNFLNHGLFALQRFAYPIQEKVFDNVEREILSSIHFGYYFRQFGFYPTHIYIYMSLSSSSGLFSLSTYLIDTTYFYLSEGAFTGSFRNILKYECQYCDPEIDGLNISFQKSHFSPMVDIVIITDNVELFLYIGSIPNG